MSDNFNLGGDWQPRTEHDEAEARKVYDQYVSQTRKQKLSALAKAGAFWNAPPADVARLIEGK